MGPHANHLIGAIEARAPAGTKTFLETPAGARLSYADLKAAAARYAGALAALGVRPGDRVALQVEKSVPALLLYLAAVRAGAVFLPLNPAYTPTEMAYFLSDAEPRVLICDPAKKGALAEAASAAGVEHVETLDGLGAGSIADRAGQAGDDFSDLPRRPDDLAALLYTSGTTGRPKGAMLSHENLSSNAQALVDAWAFTQSDVILHALPVFHTHGLFVATNVALFAGGSLLYLPRFDADLVIANLPRATVMMGVPTYYSRLLATDGFTREAAAHMRLFISGSAPLSAELHRAFEARSGHAILERYGMSETSMNTTNPYEGERRPGTVGMPLAGVELRIADPETGAALAEGETGMIELKGPNVFAGYWRKEAETKKAFRDDGFFVTGDLGRIDEDGYLAIAGRETDLIISGGLNVYPAEVEAAIDEIEGVVECAVIGCPHSDFGEGVVAVVARAPGAGLAQGDVIDALKDRLAGFKRPKRVVFVDQLPRNAMGKIEKAKLRDAYRNILGD
ncbi:MAG: malonyl-CoA synthase [Alphaproteobacteria bacterium]|nr:malonyl-CoA synthase [Alphaproteobacteria bacterium]